MIRYDNFLATIDREEWKPVSRKEIHRKEWWAFRLGRLDWLEGLGRTIHRVDFATGTVGAFAVVPQLVQPEVLDNVVRRLSFWAKALSRGMRSLWTDVDGTIVVADVFGVYRLGPDGNVLAHITSENFSDIHSALPGRDGKHLLIANTGTEEILEVDWSGHVVERIAMHEVFGTGPAAEQDRIIRGCPDRRLIPIDHSKQIYHVNWARFVGGSDRMLVSCHTPGTVSMLRRGTNGHWTVEWQRGYFPHCHCPDLDEERGVFYVPVSRTDEVRAVDLATGRTLWVASGIRYGKATSINGPGHVVVGDCNGKRLVELDRTTGTVAREVALPGIPYGICPVPSR